MPKEVAIIVQNSLGEKCIFRPEVFSGTLIQLGLPAELAMTTADELLAASHRTRIAEYKTGELRHIAHDIALTGTARLSVEFALEKALAGTEVMESEELGSLRRPDPERLPVVTGPWGVPRGALEEIDRMVGYHDPEIARFNRLSAALAESFVASAAAEQLPKLVDSLRESAIVEGKALDGLLLSVESGLGQQVASPKLVANWIRSLAALTRRGTLNPEANAGEYARVLGAAFVAGAAKAPEDTRWPGANGGDLDERRAPPIFGEEIDTGLVPVKVGSLERRAQSVNWPLYCYERQEGRDELVAIDTTYTESLRDALRTSNDAIGRDRTQVAGGWIADLFADLPDGYSYQVPAGTDVALYTWMLVEDDEGSGLLGLLQDFINGQLKSHKKDIADAAGGAVEAALSGPLAAAGIPGVGIPIASGIAKEIAKGIVGWIVGLIAEWTGKLDRFPLVTVCHTTIWHNAAPVSIVTLFRSDADGQKHTFVPLGRKTRDSRGREVYSDDIYRHRHDRILRFWAGASQVAGQMPYEYMRKVHEQSVEALVWRPSTHGFGAVVKQICIDDDDGKYSVAVRADVRMVHPSNLAEPV